MDKQTPGLSLRRFSFHYNAMSLSGMNIIVIGAGIGGLAAARALALRGADVTVMEQAPEITEVGAGLQISPNGFVVLNALGLGSAVKARSVEAGAVCLHDYRGALRAPSCACCRRSLRSRPARARASTLPMARPFRPTW